MVKKIIPGFETIAAREVIDCHLNTFRYTLNYYGINLDSFTLFVLSGALGFQYGEFLLPQLDNYKVWFAGALVLDFDVKLLKNMRIPHRQFKLEGDAKGIGDLVAYINRGVPLWFLFDGRYIPESNFGVPSPGALKLNLSYPSLAAVVGYDLAEKQLYITLSGNDKNTELYRFSLDDFIQSRVEKGFPASPDNRCYELQIDEDYRSRLDKEFPGLVEEALVETCRRMVEPELEFTLPRLEATPVEFYQGVAAMRLFGERSRAYVEEILAQEAADPIVKPKLDKHFTLNFLIFRTFFANGSYTCFRGEFGQGLKKIAQRMDCQSLDRFGDQFLELADHWRAFVRMLYYVKNFNHDKSGFANILNEKIMFLASAEERLFKDMLRILG